MLCPDSVSLVSVSVVVRNGLNSWLDRLDRFGPKLWTELDRFGPLCPDSVSLVSVSVVVRNGLNSWLDRLDRFGPKLWTDRS
jgi:hypothetical protein